MELPHKYGGNIMMKFILLIGVGEESFKVICSLNLMFLLGVAMVFAFWVFCVKPKGKRLNCFLLLMLDYLLMSFVRAFFLNAIIVKLLISIIFFVVAVLISFL